MQFQQSFLALMVGGNRVLPKAVKKKQKSLLMSMDSDGIESVDVQSKDSQRKANSSGILASRRRALWGVSGIARFPGLACTAVDQGLQTSAMARSTFLA
jgi:hypothetical protein